MSAPASARPPAAGASFAAVVALRLSAVFGALAIALGAFAAHGMKGSYESAALGVFETGVRYQVFHALALLGCSLLARTGHRTGVATACFAAGVILFSGSLYGIVWWQAKWLGPVTPLGGVLLIAGWLALLWPQAHAVPAPHRE